jgi:hypothetical protein
MVHFSALFVCVLFWLQLPAQVPASTEYNIKAVFIYNFTQFIDWPPGTFASPESPFVIGILGEDPFQSYMDETVSNEKVKGHSIVVERYQNLNDVKNCHILYICASEAERMQEILLRAKKGKMLTISDVPGFANNGGMICFVTRNNKIKLQINPSPVKAAELNISSKLLQVAEITGTQITSYEKN